MILGKENNDKKENIAWIIAPEGDIFKQNNIISTDHISRLNI